MLLNCFKTVKNLKTVNSDMIVKYIRMQTVLGCTVVKYCKNL